MLDRCPVFRRTLSPALAFAGAVLWAALAYVLLGWLAGHADEQSRVGQELGHWAVVLSLLGSYVWGYRQVASGRVSLRAVLLGGVLLSGLAVGIEPFHSADLFGYINRGWQQWHYGVNPYVQAVIQTPGWEQDPMFTRHWIGNPSPYGFVFLWTAKLLCIPFSGDKWATMMVFKAFNLGLLWGMAGLLWIGISRLNLAVSPRVDGASPSLNALYLLLCNPLLLVQSLANGHNDILMAAFIVLALVLAIVGRWLGVLPALMAATLVKYGAVVLMPVAGLWVLRQYGGRALGWGVLLAGGVLAVSGWTFLQDSTQFQWGNIQNNALVSHSSAHSTVMAVVKSVIRGLVPAWEVGLPGFQHGLKQVLIGAYAVGCLGLAWCRIRRTDYPTKLMLSDALLVIAVLVCGVSPKFYPWYMVMFFPMALLLPEGQWLRRMVIGVTCAQLLGLTFVGQAHILNYLAMTVGPVVWVWYQNRRARARWRTHPTTECVSPAAPISGG